MRSLSHLFSWLDQRLLETVSSLTHLVGAVLALAALALMVWAGWGQGLKTISLAIYGITLVLLYGASALFHGIRLPPGKRMWLNRVDHAAIFLLIAGTYTPIIISLFPAGWRLPALLGIWILAVGGSTFKMFSRRIHGFLNATIYPILSWAGVVPAVLAYRIRPSVSLDGLLLLFAGGVIFMVGFVIYYRQHPDPWPGVFGHHEIWHLFVLGGTFCHVLFMLFYVAPQ